MREQGQTDLSRMSLHPAETSPESRSPETSHLKDRVCSISAALSGHPEYVAWAGLILALLFLFIRLGFADESALGLWISSDTLYPVHVFTDVLQDGYSLSGWRFSIAPCWFPDLALAGLFWVLTQNVILGTLLAGFIQIGAIVAAFHLIGKAIGIRAVQLQDTLMLGSGISITLYVAFHPGTHYPGLHQFFLPQTHVGSMLSVLFGWGMALWLIRRQLDRVCVSWPVVVVYSLLCLLAGMSNVLFMVHMLAPLTAAVLFLFFFGLLTLRYFWLPVACGWIAAFAGAFLNRALFTVADVTLQSEVSFDRVLTSLDVFMRGFAAKTLAVDPLHVVAIAWAAVAIGYLAWFLRYLVLNGRFHVRQSQIVMAAFFLTSLSSAVFSAAAIILGGSNGLAVFKDYTWSMHYAHQAFFLPLFGFPAAIAWSLEVAADDRFLRRTSWAGAIVAITMVLMPLLPSQWPATPVYAYRPPLVRFMDEIAVGNGLRYGYAGYWQARLITLLSHSDVRAYAVDGNMNPLLWVSNEEWYRELRKNGSGRPRVDFVVLDDPLWKLSREAAVGVFGEPQSEVRIHGTRVLIYHRGRDR